MEQTFPEWFWGLGISAAIIFLLFIIILGRRIRIKISDLAKANALFSEVINSSQDIIFVKDTDFKYLFCNRAFTEFIGRSEDKIVGHDDTDWFSDQETVEYFRVWDRKVFAEKKPFAIEEWASYPDNRQVLFETVKSPCFDQNGKLIGLIGISRDITERKQTEERLKKSRETLSKVFQTSPMIITITTVSEGRIIDVNEAFLKAFGFAKEEVIGKTSSELNIWRDIDTRNKAVALLYTQKKDMLFEAVFRGKTGEPIYGLVSLTPIDIDGTDCVLTTGVDITAHKQAEEALKARERSYRALVESIPGAVYRCELHDPWQIEHISAEAERITGYSIEDFIFAKVSWGNLVHPEDRELVRHSVEEGIDSKCPYDMEYRIIRKDDSVRWVYEKGKAIYSETGEALWLEGVILDISDRRTSEESLLRSKQEKSGLLRAAPVGIGFVANRIIGWSNNKLSEITGYSSEELNGMPARKLYISDDEYERVGRIKHADIRKFGVGQIETVWVKKNGKPRDILLASAAIDSENFDKGLVFTALDITERKQAENALKDSENKYRSMYCAMSEGVALHEIVYDDTGIAIDYRITDVNPAYEKLTDIRREDAVGSLAMQIYKTDSPPYIEIYGKVADSGEPFQFESYFAPMKKHFSISVYSPKKGSFVTIFSDVTDRKTDEEERKKLESRLRQAQNMEALGTLAGGIAHDFNNILFPIMGYADMTMDDMPKDSRAYQNLQEILKAANRAKELVNQILTFSRQKEHEKSLLNIQPIVKEALKLIRSTLPSTIQIIQKITPNRVSVMGDPTQIHQIVMNLCTNAYHAMQDSGGLLEVTLMETELSPYDLTGYPDSLPGTYLKFSVRDTGIGIPKEVRERIFDPFFTTKPVGKGTGLGLSVIHGIVKQMGGYIRLYSEPGKGSVFHVYLPVIKDKNINISGDSSVRDDLLPMGNERILLVDDEEPILNMLHQMLEELGYRVTPRTSSVEAFKAFQNRPDGFDLVITDMTMPNMTGAHLARKIISIRNDIPIILCTGFSEHINEEKSKILGICGYLMKPVIRSDMAKAIRKVLTRSLTDMLSETNSFSKYDKI